MALRPPYKVYKFGKFKTSEIEIVDLAKAWIAISAAFAIVFGGGFAGLFSINFIIFFLISAFTVGIGFILHELGHKITAERYGCVAEFRSDDRMLMLAILISFLGFVFAAPGAVLIAGGRVDTRRNGIISAAGPIMNLILAGAFLAVHLFSPSIITILGYKVNAFIALFNMIPLGIFDGSKIWRWNKLVWVGMVAIAVFISFFIGGFL